MKTKYHKFETSSGTYKLKLKTIPDINVFHDHRRTYYRLTTPDGKVLFEGKDFSVPKFEEPTHKKSAIRLLGFLTLKPGDTDQEYFEGYTDEQLTFTESNDCEELSMIVYDYKMKG